MRVAWKLRFHGLGRTDTLLRLAATTLGIKKLELGANGGRVIFRPQPNVEPLTIIKMIQAQPRVYALDGQDKLRFKMPL
jgi:transcription-repair coupling factor (superfamily II helicase)